jgi:hypothetical protein
MSSSAAHGGIHKEEEKKSSIVSPEPVLLETPAAMLMKQSCQSQALLTLAASEFFFKYARINGTKQISKVRRLFRATLNGWETKDFHRYCDGQGPTLCLVQSTLNYLSAGFTSVSWKSTDGTNVEDSSAMVFALTNELQVFKTNVPKYAVWHGSRYGPYF